MAGMMETIKDYLRLCHGVVRVPLAYIIRKIKIVQTNIDYPMYTPPDDKMIITMLHLPPDKNRLHNQQSAQS